MLGFLSFLLAAQFALAGNGHVIGNGGNTVTCPSNPMDSIFLPKTTTVLDLMEGRVFYNYHYKKLSQLSGQTLETAFPLAVRTFLPLSSWEQIQFLNRFSKRAKQTFFVTEDLPLLSNNSSIFLFAESLNCEIQQAAIQYGPQNPSPEDPLELKISKKIWETLQTDQKIALLFHEYLLKDRILSEGACAVQDIRDLIAFILSDESTQISPQAWRQTLDRQCEPPGNGVGAF